MDKRTIKKIVDYWENLEPFTCVEDIPEIPLIDDPELYSNVIVSNLLRCGAIPIDKLECGRTYFGNSRNTEEATWNGHCFYYKRKKFGYSLDDTINHFQEDDGHDLFVPLKVKPESPGPKR